VVKLRKNYI